MSINQEDIIIARKQISRDVDDNLMSALDGLLDLTALLPWNSKAVSETVLLGSDIDYHLEESASDQETRTELKDRLLEILDQVELELRESSKEVELHSDYAELRSHFLKQIPKNQKAFEAINILKRYDKNDFTLSNINIELNLGEILGIVGENGSGKSTLLKIIASEIKLDEGEIRYPALGTGSDDWARLKQTIAYVPQKIREWGSLDSVKNQLHFYASIKGIKGAENQKTVDFFINRLGLKKFENHRWEAISGGYQLRFELAKALLWKPKLLILDEPLANLDVIAQATFLNDLEQLVKSIRYPFACVISSQNLFDVERLSDKIIFIKDGKPRFSGATENIGLENDYRCYELESNWGIQELKRALNGDSILKFKNQGQYVLLYTKKSLQQSDLFREIAEKGVSVNYIRDISKSTRVFFELE